jgi:hypothetical protein
MANLFECIFVEGDGADLEEACLPHPNIPQRFESDG